MTEAQTDKADKKRRLKKTLFASGIGAVVGFFGAMGVMKLLDGEAMPEVSISVEIAVLVALLYVLTGFAVGVGLVSPKMGASFLNVEDADELREQRSMLGYSAIGMTGAGLALGIAALGGEIGVIDPALALALYGVLMVLSVWVSLKSWSRQDELMRAVGRETGSSAFYLVLAIGGTWALLAHLGFATGPDPLDWLTMFWALMLIAAFIVVGRRGMLMMR